MNFIVLGPSGRAETENDGGCSEASGGAYNIYRRQIVKAVANLMFVNQ